MKPPKPVFVTGGAQAFYSPIEDQIFYNQDLDDFPRLKEFILKHERGHAEHRNNYFYHVYRDLVDYPKQWMMRDWHEYQDELKRRREYMDTRKVLWWQWLGFGAYLFANLLIQVIILPASVAGMTWWLFAKKKGGKKNA